MRIDNLTPQEMIEVELYLRSLQDHNPRLKWELFPISEKSPVDEEFNFSFPMGFEIKIMGVHHLEKDVGVLMVHPDNVPKQQK